MKAKVLIGYYPGESGFRIARVYLEKDFDQADKDLEMMQEHASDTKTWKLEETELFNN